MVRYSNNGIGHSVFITGVSGNTVSFGDCNAAGPNVVRWGSMNKSKLKAGFSHAYSAPYALTSAATPAPTPAPTPVTPEIMLSQSSISLQVGQKVTLTVGAKSPTNYYLNSKYSTKNVVTGTWGNWDSNGKIPMTITATHAGTTTLEITMYDKANKVLTSKSIPVTVYLTTAPTAKISQSSVTLEVGSSTKVSADIAYNGASKISWDLSDWNICSGTGTKASDTRHEFTKMYPKSRTI